MNKELYNTIARIAPEPPRGDVRDVDRSVSELQAAVEDLDGVISALTSRLAPVIRSYPECPKEGQPVGPKETRAPLADCLDSIGMRICAETVSIRALLERLQV